MGHLMLRNMKKVLEALGELTVAKDGVDGSRIQQYAEAWSFGEASSTHIPHPFLCPESHLRLEVPRQALPFDQSHLYCSSVVSRNLSLTSCDSIQPKLR